MSFDVESLFTNVPVEESITIIKRRLQQDSTVEERTTLSGNTVVDLLDLCLKSTYFQYKGEFYQQVDGAAMGSPVSPIVANIYMEEFEHQALNTAPERPRLWKRYVDDTFCIVKGSTVEGFLAHLNSLKPTIQFTMELETQGHLPFLDACLQRHSDGSLVTSVYRKPTHTDRYLQYDSHHPTHVKRGVVRCLFERAQSIAQGRESQKEEKHLKEVLGHNGYPARFIRNSTRPTRRVEEQESPVATISIPYVAGLSEDIRRIAWRHNIRTTFRTQGTLRQTLTKVKDQLADTQRSNVVYRIPCSSCDKVYIGETQRALGTRIKEHQDACRLGYTEKSAIAEHAWDAGHRPDWEGIKILDTASKKNELLVKEAIHIQLTPSGQLLNRDRGWQIPEAWNSTLWKMTSSRNEARYQDQSVGPDRVTSVAVLPDSAKPGSQGGRSSSSTISRSRTTNADPRVTPGRLQSEL